MGFKWGKLDLNIRSVRCLNCDIEHDRDENGTKNIEQSRPRALEDSKRTGKDRKTSSEASCCELSRITVVSARRVCQPTNSRRGEDTPADWVPFK